MDTLTKAMYEVCRQHPERIAVVDCDKSTTYAELERQSNIIAHKIYGITRGKNAFIVLLLPRRVCAITAMFASQKAGCAYVPINADYPAERINYVIKDCEAAVVVTTAEMLKEKESSGILNFGGSSVILLDAIDWENAPAADIDCSTPDMRGMMLYTSGSAGAPKGVLHAARSVHNLTQQYTIQPGADTPWYSTAYISDFSFIVHLHFALAPLLTGGCVHVIEETVRKDFIRLYRYLCEHSIYCIFMPSRLGAAMLNQFSLPVKRVVLGGEKVSGIAAERLNGEAEVYNQYGMTEVVAFGPSRLLKVDDAVIGKESPTVSSYVVDENMQPVEPGEIGELCICSDELLFTEYLHLPELTAEKIIDCPFNPGHRMFRTGDRVRRTEQGYRYCGRTDNMVKLRGLRVETGEIENTAAAYPGMDVTVCVLRNISGEDSLCLYYRHTIKLNYRVLQKYLSERLPAFMVPAFYKQLDEFPLNARGKIVRSALPEIEFAEEETVLPANDVEQKLFAITAGTLHHHSFGVTSNLISAGMTSLSAMQICAAIQQTLKRDITVAVIMQNPTIRSWAEYWQSAESGEAADRIYEKREYYPVAENQRGLYVEWDMNRKTTKYNNPVIRKFSRTTPEALQAALIKIINAHPHLKTHFAVKDGDIVQLRLDDLPAEITIAELPAEPDSQFLQSRVLPFDLLSGPLYRFEIYNTPAGVYLFSDIHHTIFDGTSAKIFNAELDAALQGKEIAAETFTAFDRAVYEHEWGQSREFRNGETYFQKLTENAKIVSYPYSQYPDSKTPGAAHARIAVAGDKIAEFCQEHALTQSSYFMTALAQTLHRITREEALLFAAVSSGRNTAAMQSITGMFVKTLPVVSTVKKEETYSLVQTAEVMQKQFTESMANELYPFNKIAASLPKHPEIIFAYQGGLDLPAEFALRENSALTADVAKMPISIEVIPNKDGYIIALEYDTSLYCRKDMQTFLQCLKVFAESAPLHPDNVNKISLVSKEEEQALVKLSAGEKLEYDRSKTFIDLFLEQAAARPEAVALVDEYSSMTYKELAEQSNLAAAYLIENGVKPDDFVCVMLPRTKEFIIAAIGIMRAGAAYVPLGIEYPEERRNFMMQDSEARQIITQEILDKILSETVPAECINKASPDSRAFMIYTSGSTDKPKGVVVCQRALTNLIHFCAANFRHSPFSRACCHSSYSFDGSVGDTYSALAAGGTLYIVPFRICKDLQLLNNYLADNQIKTGFFTTQLGVMLLENNPDLPLDFIQVGGEKLTHVPAANGCRFQHVYGPTEFTVYATCFNYPAGKNCDNVPIGRPLYNTAGYVVDPAMQLLPQGAAGELCLAGIQIAEGYWKRPELTAEKFVDCPYSPGRKMYRTGDLVRYNEDGDLEFLRRIDHQVKLRGFRVEMGEIENAALQFNGIKTAAASAKVFSSRAQNLCLYFTADREIDKKALKSFLAQSLADYMVPDCYMQLAAMPLSPNGKINREALPEPELDVEENKIIPPENDMEQRLYDIVADVLKHNKFGVTNNLISVGMNSIAAMRISAALQQKMNVYVPTKDILAAPYIRTAAEYIQTLGAAALTDVVSERREFYPICESQRGLYLDWERERNSIRHNIPIVKAFKNATAEDLRKAIIQAVNAHPHLKTHFAVMDGEIVQLRLDDEPVNIAVIKLDETPSRELFQSRVKPFDLQRGPLHRFEIYEAPDGVYLFCDVHHTIFDGSSIVVFEHTVSRALNGENPSPETFTAFDRAVYEQEWMQSAEYKEAEKYFRNLVQDAEVAVYPHSAVPDSKTSSAANIHIAVEGTAINSFCKKFGFTPNSFFMTALAQVLHRITSEKNLLFTSINNGRSSAAMQNITGMFVKTLPVVSNTDKGEAYSLRQAVGEMQKEFLESVANELYPYAKIVGFLPKNPEIMFAYQGDLDFLPTENLHEQVRCEMDTVKMPLAVMVMPGENGTYLIELEYDPSLYSRKDMQTFLQCLKVFAESAPQNPENVNKINVVTEAEIQELLQLSAGEKFEYDRSKTFVDLFLEQAAAHPEATALADESGSITYGELAEHSNILAAFLIEIGVKQNDFIALILPRKKEFAAAIIGVMRAGAAYIPVDMDYPEEIRKYVIGNSKAKVVMNEEMLCALFKRKADGAALVNRAVPDGRAYMIYTSGSTGKPKGVVIRHAALYAFIVWGIAKFGINSRSRHAQHSSFSFDASLHDLLWPLAAGGSTHILSSSQRKDINLLYRYIVEHQITGTAMSVQLGMLMLNTYPDLPLDFIIMGGEKMLPSAKTNVKICNAYGPTEFTVCSSFHLVEQNKNTDIPIGRPVPNSWGFICDMHGNLLPRGTAGELCLAGVQLAEGYWSRPELTAAKFADCPYLPGQKMYRTGDLVRYNDDGNLEYLGRMDHQVKLRGFRVELGGIESVAAQFAGINAAAAEVKISASGRQQLCLYYTASGRLNKEKLKDYLAQKLVDYMVPSCYVQMRELPMLPNGKINRRALPEPELEQHIGKEPETPTEHLFVNIFKEILGLETVYADDNFFDIGGSSITAMRVMAAAGKAGVELSYANIFDCKTAENIGILTNSIKNKHGRSSTIFYARTRLPVYDYSAVNLILSQNTLQAFKNGERRRFQNVLLTGATGFLGIHVLYELLHRYPHSHITCLVRDKGNGTAARRLQSLYFFYFSERLSSAMSTRITVVSGDITAAKSLEPLTGKDIDTVINCAANVKHFSAGTDIEEVNYSGVMNLIDFCKKNNAQLIHTSTISIAGSCSKMVGGINKLTEEKLFIEQVFSSKYPLSKFLAERAILQEVAENRLEAKIMRLGNLAPRNRDGEFQINFHSNASMNRFKTFYLLGKHPREIEAQTMEFSPIDSTAEALLLLAQTPKENVVFHPYNINAVTLGDVLNAMNELGLLTKAADENDFQLSLRQAAEDICLSRALLGLLAYRDRDNIALRSNEVSADLTAAVLAEMNFYWPATDMQYFHDFLRLLQEKNFFEG